MKIYELPSEIQQRVFQLQIEAGNKPDASLELINKSTEGNFDWHKSVERMRFWESINKGFYLKFYKEYPNALVNKRPKAEEVAKQILKECHIVLSKNNEDDLYKTVVGVLLKNNEVI